MAEIKRNRSLVGDVGYILTIAAALNEGRLELSKFETRNAQNKRVTKVRALLMHELKGPALVGIGSTATEAAHELREAIEREAARHGVEREVAR